MRREGAIRIKVCPVCEQATVHVYRITSLGCRQKWLCFKCLGIVKVESGGTRLQR